VIVSRVVPVAVGLVVVGLVVVRLVMVRLVMIRLVVVGLVRRAVAAVPAMAGWTVLVMPATVRAGVPVPARPVVARAVRIPGWSRGGPAMVPRRRCGLPVMDGPALERPMGMPAPFGRHPIRPAA
jgi:hypothetical protein